MSERKILKNIKKIIPLGINDERLGHYVDNEGLPCEYGKGNFVANIMEVDLPINFEVI